MAADSLAISGNLAEAFPERLLSATAIEFCCL
jgi:hypothetical protein